MASGDLTPLIPPVEVPRTLLLAIVAVAAVVSIATDPPLSSFAGGFAAGAGAVFVISFLTHPRGQPGPVDEERTP